MKADNEFTAARRASGITQAKAAEMCGLSKPTYCLRENNPEEFRLAELKDLYAHMNTRGRMLLKEGIGSLFL
ncbi:helix-turn-helix domain-containing protein [Olegusella massiliensis]|uniref:helix-turn-helix domain-containing protein n=1 Tax=Olegusella massiliensis TaxID=1776381 RepID=UPI0040557D05